MVVKPSVLWDPLVGLLPLQPPDAVQAVAFVAVHVKTAAAPLATVAGEALSTAVGDGAGSEAEPPPHAIRDIAATPGQTLRICIAHEASKRSRQRCDMNLQHRPRAMRPFSNGPG